jgi:predicted type IV restriction endonuclease
VSYPGLDFPEYELKIQTAEDKALVFDIVRKKFVVLTPEEWVRQHVIHHLVQAHGVSLNRISVEHFLKWNTMQHRCDIVVFSTEFVPKLIVECKAAKVPLTQKVLDQVARYNIRLKVPYLMVTNGLHHIYAHIDFGDNSYRFLKGLDVNTF